MSVTFRTLLLLNKARPKVKDTLSKACTTLSLAESIPEIEPERRQKFFADAIALFNDSTEQYADHSDAQIIAYANLLVLHTIFGDNKAADEIALELFSIPTSKLAGVFRYVQLSLVDYLLNLIQQENFSWALKILYKVQAVSRICNRKYESVYRVQMIPLLLAEGQLDTAASEFMTLLDKPACIESTDIFKLYFRCVSAGCPLAFDDVVGKIEKMPGSDSNWFLLTIVTNSHMQGKQPNSSVNRMLGKRKKALAKISSAKDPTLCAVAYTLRLYRAILLLKNRTPQTQLSAANNIYIDLCANQDSRGDIAFLIMGYAQMMLGDAYVEYGQEAEACKAYGLAITMAFRHGSLAENSAVCAFYFIVQDKLGKIDPGAAMALMDSILQKLEARDPKMLAPYHAQNVSVIAIRQCEKILALYGDEPSKTDERRYYLAFLLNQLHMGLRAYPNGRYQEWLVNKHTAYLGYLPNPTILNCEFMLNVNGVSIPLAEQLVADARALQKCAAFGEQINRADCLLLAAEIYSALEMHEEALTCSEQTMNIYERILKRNDVPDIPFIQTGVKLLDFALCLINDYPEQAYLGYDAMLRWYQPLLARCPGPIYDYGRNLGQILLKLALRLDADKNYESLLPLLNSVADTNGLTLLTYRVGANHILVTHYVRIRAYDKALACVMRLLAQLDDTPWQKIDDAAINYSISHLGRTLLFFLDKPKRITPDLLTHVLDKLKAHARSKAPLEKLQLALLNAYVCFIQDNVPSALEILQRACEAPGWEQLSDDLTFHIHGLDALCQASMGNVSLACQQYTEQQAVYNKLDTHSQIYYHKFYFNSSRYLYLNDPEQRSTQRKNFAFILAQPDEVITASQIGFSIYLLLSKKCVDYATRQRAFRRMYACNFTKGLPKLVQRLLKYEDLYYEIFRLVINLRIMSYEFAHAYETKPAPEILAQVELLQNLSNAIMDKVHAAMTNSHPDNLILQSKIKCLRQKPATLSAEAIKYTTLVRQIHNLGEAIYSITENSEPASVSPVPGSSS